jgi:formyl-CoA transferase
VSRNAEAPTPRPLSGLRVLELGTLIAGPFAGRLLADFGADVIKVEHPAGGDPLRRWGMAPPGLDSLWSLVQQRGKRSVALDLHDEGARRIVADLAAESDVLLENFRPGRLEAWGLAPDTLLERNERLIVVRISGYGQTGPLADQPGFGTTAEAAAGLRFITGDPDRPPTRSGISLGDSVASLYAVIGTLLALQDRERSGRGQVVDVSLAESVFSLLEGILVEYSFFGAVRGRTGNLAHNSAPSDAYPTSDGALVCIGANSTGLFRRLLEITGRVDLASDPDLQDNRGRVRRVDELNAAIAAWTSRHTAEAVEATLRAQSIPVSRINSIADIVAEPHFRERRAFVEVDDERLGSVLVPGIVPKLSRTPGEPGALGPAVGTHTAEVLEALGRRTAAALAAIGAMPDRRTSDTGNAP